MLIHGKLHLTSHGFMLDEVRSLLQKALRRPQSSRELALKACKELIGHAKNQLPWKAPVTFLFEDHCLANVEVLRKMWDAYKSDSKYDAVALLASCRTCRVAACLPVIALDSSYDPVDFEGSIEVPDALRGLVTETKTLIRMGALLVHLQNAWKAAMKVASEGQCGPDSTETKHLITYIKLASVAHDHEVRAITPKGTLYLIERTRCKATVGLVVLSALYKVTPTGSMRSYLLQCFRLATIPDVCVRLILFCTVTQLMYGSTADHSPITAVRIDWSSVSKLKTMPDWAVDKHTFRGKFGKGTTHLIKKKQEVQWMLEKDLAIFHGERPKTDLQHFFDVAACIECPSVAGNPYWERTQQIYYGYSPRQQKTTEMTKIYMGNLRMTYPNVFTQQEDNGSQAATKGTGMMDKFLTSSINGKALRSKITKTPDTKAVKKPDTKGTIDTFFKKTGVKRKHLDVEEPPANKRVCLVPGGEAFPPKRLPATDKYVRVGPPPAAAELSEASSDEDVESSVEPNLPGTSTSEHGGSSKESSTSTAMASQESPGKPSCQTRGPLLQLPTGSGKVYTVYVKDEDKVIKGPYKLHRLKLCLFFHRALKEVLGDKHVLEVEDRRPYIAFPILKGQGADLKITQRTFYDAISKQEIENGEFIEREHLGLVQLHKLPPEKLCKLPCTIWAHFLYRFLLNVGDSGLYNAVTDSAISFVYGIDIEESRSRDPNAGILNFMFVKLPAKALCVAIKSSLKTHKAALVELMCNEPKLEVIQKLAHLYDVEFKSKQFTDRLEKVRDALLCI